MNNFLFNMKKHLKLIIVLLTVGILCLSFALLNNIISKRPSSDVLASFEDEVAKKLDEEIDDNYWVGQDVDFPESIVIPNGTEEITATNGLVIWPDNNVTTVGRVTLSQPGTYTVKYYYEKDGVTDFAEKKVFVGNKLASLASENGSITAVTAAEQEGLVFENNASNTTLSGDDALIVRLKEGNVFQYNKSIDLSNVDENGLVDIISLDYHLRDVERGEKEFNLTKESARYAFVRLSDSYNPEIYVEFATTTVANTGYLVDRYMLFNARAHNQTRYAGAFAWTEGWTNETWRQYYQHPDGSEWALYCTFIPTLGPGVYDMKAYNHSPLTWKYDPVRQLVYVSYGANKASAGNKFIHDLSVDTLYEDYVGFGGFPSGKVTVSITTDEWYAADDARFDIYSIGGIEGAELVEQYKNGYHVDDIAPPIIDLGVERTEGNKIFVPLNSEFTLPTPVEIIGGSGVKNYTVNAYVNYGDSAEFEIPVHDGKITIDKQAVYTIRYTAKSSKGTIGEEVLKVIVKDVPNALTLNTDESFFTGSFESGQEVTLPTFSIDSINTDSAIKTKITLVHDKYSQNVRTDTRNFILRYAGEYKIIYEYSDNVYSLSKEFIINASASDNVGFVDSVTINKYYIKNAEYSLPDIVGYSMSGGDLTKVDTTVEISYDNGATWTVVDRAKVKITGSDTLLIRYSCGSGDNKKTVVSDPARIVDVGYGIKNGLMIREYFIHDAFTILPYDSTLKNSDIKYTSNTTSGNNSIEFINPIDYSTFEFKFKINGNANYKKVNISLVDYEDPTIKYVLSYSNVGGVGYVSFNGSKAETTNASFEAVKAKIWAYNLDTNKMTFEGMETSLDLRSYFKSALCYLQVELVDINGQADFIVDAVNGQNLRNNSKTDNGNPRISINDFTGNYLVGDVITLTKPTITDTLSPILDEKIKLSVTNVDTRENLKDINGVELKNVSGLAEYQFVLPALGEYKITYSYADGSGRSSSKNYSVFAVDNVKPVIKFNKVNVAEMTIEAGTTIDASFVATDNVTESSSITTSLWVRDLGTEGMYTVHHPDNLVHFNYAGVYRVYAFAQDKAGNYVFNSFLVNVVDSTEVA